MPKNTKRKKEVGSSLQLYFEAILVDLEQRLTALEEIVGEKEERELYLYCDKCEMGLALSTHEEGVEHMMGHEPPKDVVKDQCHKHKGLPHIAGSDFCREQNEPQPKCSCFKNGETHVQSNCPIHCQPKENWDKVLIKSHKIGNDCWHDEGTIHFTEKQIEIIKSLIQRLSDEQKKKVCRCHCHSGKAFACSCCTYGCTNCPVA